MNLERGAVSWRRAEVLGDLSLGALLPTGVAVLGGIAAGRFLSLPPLGLALSWGLYALALWFGTQDTPLLPTALMSVLPPYGGVFIPDCTDLNVVQAVARLLRPAQRGARAQHPAPPLFTSAGRPLPLPAAESTRCRVDPGARRCGPPRPLGTSGASAARPGASTRVWASRLPTERRAP